ncbi:HupE/UreJ family protein [Methylomonas sp. DH-1]|uniref:HupE/UreJ family protein n=1 Tax=Methylomonas sp. (strain DH-1) TaxID=1727196 RepID=UPI0038D4DD2A
MLVLIFAGFQFIDLDSIGWSHGFSHPLSGWDHLVTMLAVGIWAAQLRGQAVWMLPLAFVGVMSLGGLAGATGLAIPSVEGIILLSCAVFGVLITRKIRFSAKINVMIVAFFAFFHGFAHGQEISTSASLISYTLGFMLATLLLHGAGILVAKLVVFTISCLLTVMFSSASLAETIGSTKDDNVKNASLNQNARISLIAPSCLAVGQTRFSANRDAHLFPQELLQVSHSIDSQVFSVRSQTKIDLEKNSVGSNGFGLLLKHLSFHRLTDLQHKWLVESASVSHDCLSFKHYFPDINHTPGKQLLSNGVGLTSPPSLLANASLPKVSSDLRKTSIQSIEELYLQLIFAKFTIGIFQLKAIYNNWLDCNPRNASHRAVTPIRYRNHFSFDLLAPVGSSDSSSAAMSAIFRFHSLFANRQNLPLAMIKTWPVRPHLLLT